jgi:folate-binding protein YgfZ
VASSLRGIVRLPEWGLIRARGEDAASFLHGQLTQDVAHLTDGQARLAGFCSAKGRLLASFAVWRAAPDDLLLACTADLLVPTLKRLSMFVLRARCRLSDASAEFAVSGMVGSAAPAAGHVMSQAGGWLIGLPAIGDQHRGLWVAPADAAAPEDASLDAAAWRWLEVSSGVVRIVAATSDQFVPQMVNLELVGGVSFQKGCYPGQEVVARSQYRGTLKRRTFLFECSADARPGQEVFLAAEPQQPAGMVALAATYGGRHRALVEVKLAALDAGELHLGSAQGPLLRRIELPYAVPSEATA